jgi:hypothetical protein
MRTRAFEAGLGRISGKKPHIREEAAQVQACSSILIAPSRSPRAALARLAGVHVSSIARTSPLRVGRLSRRHGPVTGPPAMR